jgi:hypothetical protein
MALSDSEPSDSSGPSASEYRLGVTDLIAQTFSLYARGFAKYILIVGILSTILAVFPLAILWILFGVEALTLVSYVGTSPSSFMNGMSSLAFQLASQELIPMPGFEITITADLFVLFGVGLVISFVGAVIIAFISGSSIKYALEDYGGQPIEVGDAFSFAGGRFGSLLITSFIQEFIIILVGLPGVLLLLTSLTILDPTLLLSGMFAFLAGMVITFFIQVRLFPASAVVVAEDKSAFDALKRAYHLTSGEFWHIFGGQILLGLITILFTALLPFAFDLFFVLEISNLIVSIISALLFTSLSFIYQAVLYRDLEARKSVTKQEWW